MYFLSILSILSFSTLAQKEDSTFTDCNSALNIGQIDSFSMNQPPSGFGSVKEFSAGDRNNIYDDTPNYPKSTEEHHMSTEWQGMFYLLVEHFCPGIKLKRVINDFVRLL